MCIIYVYTLNITIFQIYYRVYLHILGKYMCSSEQKKLMFRNRNYAVLWWVKTAYFKLYLIVRLHCIVCITHSTHFHTTPRTALIVLRILI